MESPLAAKKKVWDSEAMMGKGPGTDGGTKSFGPRKIIIIVKESWYSSDGQCIPAVLSVPNINVKITTVGIAPFTTDTIACCCTPFSGIVFATVDQPTTTRRKKQSVMPCEIQKLSENNTQEE